MYSSVLLILSGSDLMVIAIVALMLFGGDKLPELARGLGKGIRDFKDASEGVKREINNQINSYEEKKAEDAVAKATPQLPPAPAEEPVAEIAEHQPSADANEIPGPEVVVPNTVPLSDSHHTVTGAQTGETTNEPVKTT